MVGHKAAPHAPEKLEKLGRVRTKLNLLHIILYIKFTFMAAFGEAFQVVRE